ncbi:Jouberin [Dissostichus eleginoides]|uniref:Jouberin n=1 Tax=Dissostichus eleginoides TaxID=100907 RepID=A0AAD9B1B6_DISEL|nr:Jouberin [Dissostichus eleginoides]
MPAGESKDRAKTRERFNEVFKKYSDSDKKKSKKKRPEAQEEILLQTLKKRLDLEKLLEQEVQQNIYDPEQEVQQNIYDPEQEERGGGKGAKRKSKKGKGRGDKEAKEAEDKLLQEYQLQIAQQETKTQEEEEERSVKTKEEEEERRSVKPKEEEEERRSVKPKEETQNVSLNNDAPPAQVFDDSLVLGVFVHRTDGLQSDLLVSHPMVKVHVVEERSGKYVRKEDSHRPVSSFYEQQNVEHVLPIITQPFDFKKNKSIIPEWREQIIFNERFGYFLQENQEEAPRVILFFEILDFMTMEEARANAAVDPERGFRKIAWAFLKVLPWGPLVGTNGVLNIDSKLRLQLFCPPARAKRTPGSIEVFEWWSKFPRNKYSSTLYVTVKGIALPEHVRYTDQEYFWICANEAV